MKPDTFRHLSAKLLTVQGADAYYSAAMPTKSEHSVTGQAPRGAELIRLFGRRVRAMRRHHKKTQDELASEIGCPAWKLSRIERARITMPPSFEVLLALRRALRVSLDYLLAGSGAGMARDPRVAERLAAVNRLPPDQTERLLRILDAFLDDPQVAPFLESR